MRRFLLAAAVCGLVACQTRPTEKAASSPPPGPVAEAKALLDQGQLEAALAKLQAAGQDAEALYLQGRIWAKKAESAPAPLPPTPTDPLPRGAQPPAAPEFKAEELTAVELFERALAAQPTRWEARLALGQLLVPHALRRHDLEREAAVRKKGTRKGQPTPAPESQAAVDFSVDRVLRELEVAVRDEGQGSSAVEVLIEFATRVGRVEAAEAGFQELLRRVREKPEPMVRYGDFLRDVKGDSQAAIDQYRQALIWKPDEEAVRTKIAEIYLDRAAAYLTAEQWASADGQLHEAAKYITDKSSPQAATLESYREKLRGIRRTERPLGVPDR